MPSIFSGLDAISSSSGSSQDHEELNKLKTEVNEKLSIKQSTANSGKILKVGNDGNIEFVDGVIDDSNVSNKTTYSSDKIKELINNSAEIQFATDEEVQEAIQAIIDSYEGRN